MRRTRTIEDDEAVAVITGYIINIGVAMMVITVLVLGLQGTVDDVRDVARSTTLEVATERLASAITEADTMANTGLEAEGQLEIEIQESLDQTGYTITLEDDSIDIAAGTTNVSTSINTTNEIVNATITGGGTQTIHFNETHIWIAR